MKICEAKQVIKLRGWGLLIIFKEKEIILFIISRSLLKYFYYQYFNILNSSVT